MFGYENTNAYNTKNIFLEENLIQRVFYLTGFLSHVLDSRPLVPAFSSFENLAAHFF